MRENLQQYKGFISDNVKGEIVYRDHIEVIFHVVFSFVDDEIIYKLHITTSRWEIKYK